MKIVGLVVESFGGASFSLKRVSWDNLELLWSTLVICWPPGSDNWQNSKQIRSCFGGKCSFGQIEGKDRIIICKTLFLFL